MSPLFSQIRKAKGTAPHHGSKSNYYLYQLYELQNLRCCLVSRSGHREIRHPSLSEAGPFISYRNEQPLSIQYQQKEQDYPND